MDGIWYSQEMDGDFIVGASSSIGRVSFAHWGFQSRGYDSIYFNPGDGGEYIIWDPSRVISMKRV